MDELFIIEMSYNLGMVILVTGLFRPLLWIEIDSSPGLICRYTRTDMYVIFVRDTLPQKNKNEFNFLLIQNKFVLKNLKRNTNIIFY